MSLFKLKNDNLLRAAKRQKVDRIPVWIMRQAGRYLPEFRELRAEHNFFQICQTPELACEVTLQPIRRFDLDAAIIFSDILVIPQALGMTVEMKPGVGPILPQPLVSPEDIDKLHADVDVRDVLSYVHKAIELTVLKLEGSVPLIGFCGGPWTLMGYMIEGGGSKTLSEAKKWLYKWPDQSKRLLSIITKIIIEHLKAQSDAGAQLLQVFESNAEYLGPELFEEFALPYIKEIVKKVKEFNDIPMTIFAKGGHYAISQLSEIGYDVVGLDWTIDPRIRKNINGNVALQGNLDPCALYAPKEKLQKLTKEMVDKFGTTGYIANLGHGIYPDADPENVKNFIEAIHSIPT